LKRYGFIFFILLLSQIAAAYTRITTSSGQNPKWSSMPISYWINEKGLPGISNGSDMAAVQASFRTWENIQTASIQFTYKGTTPAATVGRDGQNVVTFIDTSAPLGSSIIAATFSFFKTENGRLLFDESDIAVNPSMDFSASGETNKFDIQSVLTHEVGHLLGLDHAGLISSVMVPFGAPSQLDQRTLAYDDIAGVIEIYPNPSTLPATGQIRGMIQADAGPIFGAHVVAVDSNGTAVVSTLSQRDGSYVLRFVPPDTYRVYAEPLDGPVTKQNLGGGSNGFFSSIKTNFGTTYFGNVSMLADAATIDVAPNAVATADVQTFPASASGLNLTRPAFGIRISRGRTGTLTVGGVDITDGIVVTGSNPGLQFGALTFGGRVSSTAPTSVSMRLTLSPSTPLGPKNLAVNRGTDASIVSGAFVVTDSLPSVISANPSAGPIEGGTIVTIGGTNFRSGAQVYFAGLAATDIRVVDASTIHAAAPANTPGGVNVVVVNSDGTWGVGSQVFTYVSQSPTISRVSPLSGPPATQVLIEGDHFDTRVRNIEVQFNGFSARVTSASVNAITAIVPFGATTGPITVTLFGQTANGPVFTVTASAPSSNSAGPTFQFVDASSGNGGTALTFGNNDDAIASVNLPFNFILFRDIYLADSSISVAINGYLSLEPLSVDEFENASLPSKTVSRPGGSVGTVPPSLIAPFWDDLIMHPDSAITTKTIGSAPNRQFVIEWSNMSILDENGTDLNANLTFEAVLYEGTNDIQFLYRSMAGPRSDGIHATVGAQNLRRDTAIQSSFNQPVISTGYFVTYHFQSGRYSAAAPDQTPPAKPVVTDEGPVTSNGTQLAASWTSDGSGPAIREYRYAIGTTAGGTDVRPFTSTTQNSVVVTGLTLRAGVTYYFAVKAISVAGLESEIGVSAGVHFDPAYQPQVKIIPSSPENNTEFTGIAFLALNATSVVLKAMDGSGNLISGSGIRNPVTISLTAGQQYAKLVSELFGVQSFDGWIEADASAPGLGIFVATGSRDLQHLDGNAVRDPSSDFVLFHPGASAILVNPSVRIANVTLTEFGTGRNQSLTIPPRGRSITTLTGVVRVQSSEALAAVERLYAPGKPTISAAVPVSESQAILVFPHAATGGGYSSTLSVVNLGRVPQTLTVTFGTSSASLQLDSNAATRLSIAQLLHLPVDSVRTDAVRVSTMSPFGSNASVIGVLDLENPADAVPIGARPAASNCTLPYVANGNGFFTGLAFATGAVAAKITIEVYSRSGGTPLSATMNLDANRQLSRLLSELVPASANQAGGYIRIHSDQPIWSWEIYGTSQAIASGPPL
jgi:hypothetical protein